MKTAEKTSVASESGTVDVGLGRNRGEILPRLNSSKIGAAHLEKLAVVYVRQSSPQQVMENRESRERQYALADYGRSLGWRSERVLVIDEDQGQSGTWADNRSGFQRLLAEVTMDHVGIVLGLEMSRLARSSKDWHHLFELCGIFGTLLADNDGVYAPNDPNDRLLLGLKGIMSEVELQTMRNRLERGRFNKAQRGELFFSVPMGYVILPSGEVVLDPDEQVRSIVHLVFDKFEELGSARAAYLWFVQHQINLPKRCHRGSRKDQIERHRPLLSTINRMLRHPIYAGAYAYGRRPKTSRRNQAAGKRQSWAELPMDQWQVLIRDHLPAYINWDQCLRNLERLKQNRPRADTAGAPRNGSALLGGLLVCGNCGRRMQVGYHAKDKLHYRCQRYVEYGAETPCFGLTGNVLDLLVSQQVLTALEPAALELSLQAQADLRRERQQLDQHWQQNLKRARYEVESAERHYRAVDPENRLVAATLERQWEQALRQERELQEEYDRSRQQNRPEPNSEEMSQIQALSSNVPALWHSPQTSNADRQSIIRCLIEQVVLYVERNSERAEAVIHWAGGYESRVEFRRPVQTYEQLRDFENLKKRIRELWKSGHSDRDTAGILNAEGFFPINPDQGFNRVKVLELRRKLGLRDESNGSGNLASGEWSLHDLARHLNMRGATLRNWAARGWVKSRQTSAQRRWILWADREEVSRLRKLLASRSNGNGGYPSNLTTPKPRPKLS